METESKASNNRHKDVDGLVKEIFHEWEWGKNEEFKEDLKNKDAESFAIQFHTGVGRSIRNEYGFWKQDTDLYKHMLSLGLKHADDMSHHVFLELYKYGKKELGIA